jgi:protein TonB
MHAAARTTSMLASAALLGALAFAGLTMTFGFTPNVLPDPMRPVAVIRDEPAPPPPPVVHPRTTPPPEHAQETPAETTLPTDTPRVIETSTSDDTASSPAIQTITNAHWLRQPRNLQAYYPRRALQRSVEGSVQLDCRVLTTGNLRCAVVSETPAGWDFGEAALRIARDYQMTPAMRDGVPVEARYQMRVPFRLN